MLFTRLIALYRRHFRDHRRERMFLASLSFFVTFGVTRLLTHAFRGSDDPFELRLAGIHPVPLTAIQFRYVEKKVNY